MKKKNIIFWAGLIAFLGAAWYLAASPLASKVVTVGGSSAYMNVYNTDTGSDSTSALGTKAYIDRRDATLDLTGSDFTSGTTSSGEYDITDSYRWVYVDNTGVAASGVTLPAITSALDGYTVYFKRISSGTTPVYIYPYSASDTIESTQGTITGTVDASLDAQGDVRAWQARYIDSGTTTAWYLILDER